MSVTQDYKNVRISADDWSVVLTSVSTRISHCVESALQAHGSPKVHRYWEEEAALARAVMARIEVL
jgi:hypothetical protein